MPSRSNSSSGPRRRQPLWQRSDFDPGPHHPARTRHPRQPLYTRNGRRKGRLSPARDPASTSASPSSSPTRTLSTASASPAPSSKPNSKPPSTSSAAIPATTPTPISPPASLPFRMPSPVYRAQSPAELMGLEGAAAARYFRAFALLNRSGLPFPGRRRRRPTDPSMPSSISATPWFSTS